MRLEGWKYQPLAECELTTRRELCTIVGALLSGPAVGIFTSQTIQNGPVKIDVGSLLDHSEAILLGIYKKAAEIHTFGEVPHVG